MKMSTVRASDLGPLFLFCQVLGVIPADDLFKLNRSLSFWSFLAVGIFNLAVFATQVHYLVTKWEKWDLIRIILQGAVRLIKFLIVLSHFYVLRRKKRLHAKILAHLSKTNVSGMKLYYHNILTVFITLILITAYVLLIWTSPSRAGMIIMSSLQFLQIIYTQMLFCSYIEIASADIAKNTETLQDQGYRMNWIVDRHLRQLQHLKFCNRFFDYQIFLTHAFLTYYFVYSCFTIITQLWERNYVGLAAYTLFHVTSLLCILLINRACQNTTTEAEKFNAELFRLMKDDRELCKNEKLQLYVTMKQTVNFTACGFFTLGYPLVTSIIAAATTYLVILVQFSMPPPATKS